MSEGRLYVKQMKQLLQNIVVGLCLGYVCIVCAYVLHHCLYYTIVYMDTSLSVLLNAYVKNTRTEMAFTFILQKPVMKFVNFYEHKILNYMNEKYEKI